MINGLGYFDGLKILHSGQAHHKLSITHLFLDWHNSKWAPYKGTHGPPMNAVGR